ncbi:hypothetical protein [Limnoglobus roseus]|nr:hypothetical protein [Limnoglobus roseus]
MAVLLGLSALTASAQPIGNYTVLSETLVLTSDYVEVDGDFPTSAHEGGGWMSAIWVTEYVDEFDNYGTFIENKSPYATFSVDDTDVYYVETGTTLQPDGLVVAPLYVDCIEGYTEVTVSYGGQTVYGYIVVRGPDWKPPIEDER